MPQSANGTGRAALFLLTSTYLATIRKWESQTETPTGEDQILRIAWKDAEKAYRDLSGFKIRISEEMDGWHMDYELKDERSRGGGPHYIIHPATGRILKKRYEQ